MPRQDFRWEAQIIDTKGSMVGRCMVVNVSHTGARLILPAPDDVPDSFILVLSKKGEVRRNCEVTWRADKSIGVRFVAASAFADQNAESEINEMLGQISSGN